MVTKDQAVVRASEWLGVVPEQVGSHEFDRGWVVWEIPVDDDDVLAQLVGSAMGVVDHDGSITSWPSLPVDAVARRYCDWSASRGRFSDEVEDGLYAAGWYPGRSVGDQAESWLSQLLVDHELAPAALHERAQQFVDEFGRIMLVQQLDEKHKRLLRLYPLAFEALPVRDWRPDAGAAGRARASGVGGELCPVGVYQDDEDLEDVLMGDDGALYAVGTAVRRIGPDADGSVVAFLASTPWTELAAVARSTSTTKAGRETAGKATTRAARATRGKAASKAQPQPGTSAKKPTRGKGSR